jgi:hypothetical protein
MRNAIEPTVERAIVHLINHRTKDLICSELDLELDANPKLRDYFSNQVKNALGDTQTGSAKFSKDGEQAAIENCYRVLKGGKDFIPSSQELAKLLFAAMGTDERIKPASLAVCLYTASNYSTKFLALIKIDPTEALVERIETRNGKQVVTFDVRSDVMPTAREKLQKAALIPPKGTVRNLDLLLLDRQVAGFATFFAVKFLNAIPAINAKDATVRFYLAAQKAHNRLVSAPANAPEHIDVAVADTLKQHIDVAVQGRSVEFKRLLEDLPLQPEAAAVVLEELESEFPEEARIKIDKQHAQEKLTKKKRFRGDYGVLFEVESAHYDEVVLETTISQGPDGKVITRLLIEVPDLQWVK